MHLILLHGATGTAKQFDPLLPFLQPHFTIHLLNFYGHGGTNSTEPFSIAGFAKQFGAYIDNEILPGEGEKANINLFGYSMGGHVGVYFARHYAGKVKKLISLAAKFYWDPLIAAREAAMLDPDKIELKVPAFAEKLKAAHALGDWKQVLNNTSVMMQKMGNDNPLTAVDYPIVSLPCLLLVGDRDKMVSMKETEDVYRMLPNGQMSVLPATGHPIDQADPSLLAFLIKRFLAE